MRTLDPCIPLFPYVRRLKRRLVGPVWVATSLVVAPSAIVKTSRPRIAVKKIRAVPLAPLQLSESVKRLCIPRQKCPLEV